MSSSVQPITFSGPLLEHLWTGSVGEDGEGEADFVDIF